jgi:DNA-binding transcriptional regulator YdaS (Cro superfamily)
LDREVRNSAVCTDSAASRKVCVSSHSVCQNILPRPDWSYILEM